MPADIRSFFGGGPKSRQDAHASHAKDESTPAKATRRTTGRASRVIDDSDDDEPEKSAT